MGRQKSDKAARLALGLHARIQEARKKANLTQAQMAEKLGLHVANYVRIESGAVAVNAERVGEIARLLGVTVASLFGEGEAETGASGEAA